MKNIILSLFTLIFLISCHHTPPSTVQSCSPTPLFDEKNFLMASWSSQISLKGGLSASTLYKVTNGETSYVIRDISHRSLEDKKREVTAHQMASRGNYGPHLYAYDIPHGKIIMGLLEDKRTTLTPLQKREMLAEGLYKLHHGPLFCDHISLIDQASLLHRQGPYYPKDIDPKKIEKLLQQLFVLNSYPKSPTHRDLNPNNIFFTNEGMKLIDFENAGQDDPFIDLATLIIFHYPDDHEASLFLQSYFRRDITDIEKKHLKMAKQAVLLFYGETLLRGVSLATVEKNRADLTLAKAFLQIDNKELDPKKERDRYLFAISFLREALSL